MKAVRHAIYLHGFASSPQSSKARWFRERLEAKGVSSACPDLNLPAFETLTITRMLDDAARAIEAAPDGPVVLIGSSLGAFVAIHAADRDRTGLIDRLVLMAPALDFGGNRLKQLGPHGIDEWRRRGALRLMHYAYGEERDVGFALYEDAARYDALAVAIRLPVLVFQGRQDELVDTSMVERWADAQANVRLHVVDDGHQLGASLDRIWQEAAPFLGV